MRRLILFSAAVFGVTLAVFIGFRLEAASLAVATGVVLGILAGLPVSGVLLFLFWRERMARLQAEETRWERTRQPAVPVSPPVVILNAGKGPEMLPAGFALGQRQEREFVIVGEEEWEESSKA